MKIKTQVRAGGISNHNATRLKIRTQVRAGGISNHNATRVR